MYFVEIYFNVIIPFYFMRQYRQKDIKADAFSLRHSYNIIYSRSTLRSCALFLDSVKFCTLSKFPAGLLPRSPVSSERPLCLRGMAKLTVQAVLLILGSTSTMAEDIDDLILLRRIKTPNKTGHLFLQFDKLSAQSVAVQRIIYKLYKLLCRAKYVVETICTICTNFCICSELKS